MGDDSNRNNNKFLPLAMLRVLLVEPDDSTRHIISSLLCNCGYKGKYLFFFYIFQSN